MIHPFLRTHLRAGWLRPDSLEEDLDVGATRFRRESSIRDRSWNVDCIVMIGFFLRAMFA